MRLIFCILCIFFFLSAEPISRKDFEFVFLYICDLEGQYEFSDDGRAGLATISEIKKIEEKKQSDNRGSVFLISSGSFSGKNENLKGHFSLLNESGFDAAFISETELIYMEENPILQKMKLPVIAHRENNVNFKESKNFEIRGYQFRVSHILEPVEDKTLDIELIFPQIGNLDYIKNFNPSKPTYFFLSKEEESYFSFHKKNLHTASCPASGNIGKLRLYFRGKKLIRQKQEFIPLNTINSNQDWISPDRMILKSLE